MDEPERQADPKIEVSSSGGQTPAEEIRRGIEKTRVELGETVEALAEKADVKGQVTRRISRVRHTAEQKKGDLVEKVKRATPESASSGAQHMAVSAQRRPAPFVAGALAVGLLLGWLLGHRQRTS
jgi:ElaB/YqjD/DUF883 family membrane-anchored ribosome-binding protein